MTRADDAAPAWFTASRYAYLDRVSVEAARQARNAKLAAAGGDFTTVTVWEASAIIWLNALEYCQALEGGAVPLPDCREGMPPPSTPVPAYIGPPAVERIEPAEAVKDPAYKWFGRMLFVAVNLAASDLDIKPGFNAVLAQARRATPGLVRTSGPNSLDRAGRLSGAAFDRWRSDKIVEVAELNFWARACEASGERAPTKASRARWIWGDIDQPTRKYGRARDALEAAIRQVPALSSQIAELERSPANPSA